MNKEDVIILSHKGDSTQKIKVNYREKLILFSFSEELLCFDDFLDKKPFKVDVSVQYDSFGDFKYKVYELNFNHTRVIVG